MWSGLQCVPIPRTISTGMIASLMCIERMSDVSVMSTLLTTKIQPPRLPHHYVGRERLLKRLTQAVVGKLTLIHAPAGYGKTTLTVAWISVWQKAVGDGAVAWLSLDQYDNDVTRFLNHFVAAWQEVAPELGQNTAELLTTSGPNPLIAEPTMLLNQLINDVGALETTAVLVLDDWHIIENPLIQELVQYWIEHTPPHINSILTSRTVPAMPLARWRVRGQMREITADDLQFTTAEVGQFLREGLRLNLKDDDIERLTSRTEGWIAALQLIALSLPSGPIDQGGGDIATYLQQLSGSNRYLIEYLVTEVLQKQTDTLRQFLEDTAVLERFCAPLCDAVTERNDSYAILDTIDQRNLFVTSLGVLPSSASPTRWYRYHPLLTDYLRTRLSARDPERYRQLHGRAFDWLMAHGFAEEAIEHGLQAERYEAVATLLETQVDDILWRHGRAVTLHGWLSRLPEDVLTRHLNLAFTYGWTFVFLTRFDQLVAFLGRFEAQLADERPAEVRVKLLALEAEFDLHKGDIQGVLDKLSAMSFDSLGNPLVRAVMWQVQGYALRLNGDAEGAIEALETARRLTDRRQNLPLWTYATGDLAEAKMIQADLATAEALYQEMLASSPVDQELFSPLLDFASIGYGSLLFKRNQLNQALDHVQRGLMISQSLGKDRAVTHYGLTLMAAIRQAQGDWTDAQRLLTQVQDAMYQQPSARIRFQTEASMVRLYLLAGVGPGDNTAVLWANHFPSSAPPM
jgi:LuxR family maltose regulon positive regulatory protein